MPQSRRRMRVGGRPHLAQIHNYDSMRGQNVVTRHEEILVLDQYDFQWKDRLEVDRLIEAGPTSANVKGSNLRLRALS